MKRESERVPGKSLLKIYLWLTFKFILVALSMTFVKKAEKKQSKSLPAVLFSLTLPNT